MNKVMGLVAKGCVERARALGYRGNKRLTDYTLDYWSGAVISLVATEGLDSPNVQAMGSYGHMVIAVRGYREVEELAARYDAELAAAQLPVKEG